MKGDDRRCLSDGVVNEQAVLCEHVVHNCRRASQLFQEEHRRRRRHWDGRVVDKRYVGNVEAALRGGRGEGVGAFGRDSDLEALRQEALPDHAHDARLDETEEDVRPGVPRNGPLGVGDDGSSPIDTEPIGAVRRLQHGDGGWVQSCPDIRSHVAHVLGYRIDGRAREALALEGSQGLLWGLTRHDQGPENCVIGGGDIDKEHGRGDAGRGGIAKEGTHEVLGEVRPPMWHAPILCLRRVTCVRRERSRSADAVMHFAERIG
eukprot:14902742-Alexandrium_andersonii.AAC.1